MGDFHYVKDQLGLGTLNGNKFTITLRRVSAPVGAIEEVRGALVKTVACRRQLCSVCGSSVPSPLADLVLVTPCLARLSQLTSCDAMGSSAFLLLCNQQPGEPDRAHTTHRRAAVLGKPEGQWLHQLLWPAALRHQRRRAHAHSRCATTTSRIKACACEEEAQSWGQGGQSLSEPKLVFTPR